MVTRTTPGELMEAVYTDLASWAPTLGGTIYVTKSPFDLFEVISSPPAGWRLTMHFEGDVNPEEDVRDLEVVESTFRFIVDGDLGPSAIRNAGLFRSLGTRSPMLGLLQAVRFRVLSYRFANWLGAPNDRFWYLGSDDKIPMPAGGFLAAYNVRFKLFSVISVPGSGETVTLTIPPVEEEEP